MPVRSTSKTNALPWFGTAAAIYVVWTLSTWWFEGRVGLLQRPDPLGRVIYVLVANLLVGIGVSALVLRSALRAGMVTPRQLGFGSPTRSLIGIVVALPVGFAMLLALRPATLQPAALLNGFAQVLPTTIAEVIVCWVVVGALTKAGAEKLGAPPILALALATVVADLLFGFYHFAHSAPFNTIQMVLFLLLPGLLTSFVFFGTRNVWATVVIHNFLGMKGVMDALDPSTSSRPVYPLLALALVSVGALLTMHYLLRRGESAPLGRGQIMPPSGPHPS